VIRVCIACNRQFVARRAHGLTCSKACSLERKREYDRQRESRDEQRPPGHKFNDPGAPIAEPDFKPRAIKKNPEEAWAKAFAAAGKDFGGPIDALDGLARRLVAAE
jgi:hypothetical protein